MVTLTTVPPGAEVKARDGSVLCASTPCAIPVPVGAPMPVRVTIAQGAALDATIDPSSPTARIDLSALIAPPSPPQPTTQVTAQAVDAGAPRRPDHRRVGTNTHAGSGAGEGGDLPMFMPR